MADIWHRTEIGNHIDLLTGFPFSSEYYTEETVDVRLLRGDNVIQGTIRWDDVKRWPASDAAGLTRYQLAENDIVIAMDRTWVKAGLKIAQITKTDIPSLLVQRVARLRAKGELDQNYLAQCINSYRFERYVKGNQTESAVPHISSQQICDFTIPLPRIEEQRKIATILRTWDEAIDTLLSIKANKTRQRLWFRTEVLSGKSRFRGFNKPWMTIPLSKILYEHGAKSSGTEEVFSVSVHKGLINQVEHLGRSFAAADTSCYNLVLPGDIVYTKSPTGEFPLGIIKQSNVTRSVLVSPLYGVFTPKTQELGIILDAYFESPVTVKNYLHPLVQKGAKNTIAITNKRFLEGHLSLPTDVREQEQLAAMLETSVREISDVEAEIVLLQTQKRGLMQKLLTGEWRINDERGAL